MENLCDGHKHCTDGSDEEHCGMSYFHKDTCFTLDLFLDFPNMKGFISSIVECSLPPDISMLDHFGLQ